MAREEDKTEEEKKKVDLLHLPLSSPLSTKLRLSNLPHPPPPPPTPPGTHQRPPPPPPSNPSHSSVTVQTTLLAPHSYGKSPAFTTPPYKAPPVRLPLLPTHLPMASRTLHATGNRCDYRRLPGHFPPSRKKPLTPPASSYYKPVNTSTVLFTPRDLNRPGGSDLGG